MSKYVNLTQEEIDRAAHTDIKSFLEAKGEKVIRSGNEWAWERHNSVKFRGHVFYQHSTGAKGTAIDFLCTFYDMRFPDAVITLLGNDYDGVELQRSEAVIKKKPPFSLPKRNRNLHRLYAYLMQERRIDVDIITFFVRQKTIYESADTHNVVFIGCDATGKPRAAHQRGTLTDHPYRGDVPGSEKDYFFNYVGTSPRLYVFEAPIDLLSFISIYKGSDWTKHSFIALGGLADRALARFLLEHQNIKKIIFCLDNDYNAKEKNGSPAPNHGQVATAQFANEYAHKDYAVSILKPTLKDWNEILKKKYSK
jgi:hypothetical protein